uniref:Uncharacterized protein 1972 n=1 Tax=Mycobacterium paratuberculosis TaxID=1770 RepID=Q9K523_MYCPC|nr:hypothetical protein [Mycobacterium avium subsp. paratuberculosis]
MADESDTPAAEEKSDAATQLDTDEGDDQDQGRVARWRELARRRRCRGRRRVGGRRGHGGGVGRVEAAGWATAPTSSTTPKARRNLFVATASQGAVNLTTINYTQSTATCSGSRFGHRRVPRRVRAAVQTVRGVSRRPNRIRRHRDRCGMESQRGDSAQVLVAVAVKSHTAGGDEPPREWRMRIEVRSVGDDAKVSNVVFVP